MSNPQIPLTPGSFYHIYNHGVGNRNLFQKTENYKSFLGLYDKYIDPIADTFAWVLMKNHFHFLVRIKENIVYKYTNTDRSIDAVRFNEIKWQTTDRSNLTASEGPVNVKIPKPEKHFSHLFNSYTKYYNTKYNSSGTMFERPFNRKLVDNIHYLKMLVLYIHNNPVHHGFCEHPVEYPWSSYLTCISVKSTKLHRNKVVGWFDNEANFKLRHGDKIDIESIQKWLGI